jgi:hypothetical protein
MKALRAAKVFERSSWREVELEGSTLKAQVRQLNSDQLEIRVDGETHLVTLASKAMTFGATRYLVCPASGALRGALFLKDGQLLSKEQHGLAYLSQRQSASERLSTRAEAKLAELEGRETGKPARAGRRATLEAWFEANKQRLDEAYLVRLDALARKHPVRPRRRAKPETPRLSMLMGMIHGSSDRYAMRSHSIIDRLDEAETPIPLPSGGLAPLTLRRVEQRCAPELDIRQLKPRRGRAAGHKLVWPDPDIDLAVLVALRTDAEGEHLLLEVWRADGLQLYGRQRITVVRGARHEDRFMLCPVTGRRCTKLFRRGGRFASASAQRLGPNRRSVALVHAAKVQPFVLDELVHQI